VRIRKPGNQEGDLTRKCVAADVRSVDPLGRGLIMEETPPGNGNIEENARFGK
jgi:hypothetical protein